MSEDKVDPNKGPDWSKFTWFVGLIIIGLSNYFTNRAQDNTKYTDLCTVVVKIETKVEILYNWYEKKVN